MKKSLLCVLCLCACAFAKEGDADTLAGMIFGLIGTFVILYGAIFAISAIAVFITEAWAKLNTAGKIVFFGIPLFAITTAILYVVIWTIIPEIYKLAHNIEFWIVTGALYYISTIFTGYTINYSDDIRPRNNVYGKISRIIFLTPISPIWGPIYVLIKLCKVLFIAKQPAKQNTNNRVCLNTRTILDRQNNVQRVDISKINKIANADKLLFEVAVWAYECCGLSTSAVQRHFSIGYARAGEIVDQLYQLHVIGPAKAASCAPRDIIMSIEDIMQMQRCGKFS